VPWVNGAVLPNPQGSASYRLFMTEAYPAIRNIIEKVVASGLIYLPSNALDFKNPEIDKYLQRYVHGSNGIDYKERIKVMKLLWDAIGSEFGARHELYEHAEGNGRARRALHGRLRRGWLEASGLYQPLGYLGAGEVMWLSEREARGATARRPKSPTTPSPRDAPDRSPSRYRPRRRRPSWQS
jgi:hypothetical protein